MEQCRYCVKRTKKYMYYYYCKKKREEVFSYCYRGCPFFERKGYKPINKVSKKRVTVSPETYAAVYHRCNGVCAICGTTKNLELHHVLYRSERKDLIDDPDNGIMLCGEFANNCHRGKAHKDKKYWQPLLLKMVELQKMQEDK